MPKSDTNHATKPQRHDIDRHWGLRKCSFVLAERESFRENSTQGGILFRIFRFSLFRFIPEYSGPEYLPRPGLIQEAVLLYFGGPSDGIGIFHQTGLGFSRKVVSYQQF